MCRTSQYHVINKEIYSHTDEFEHLKHYATQINHIDNQA